MEKSGTNKYLMDLVEAGDVVALERAIVKSPNLICYNWKTLGCDKPKNMREYLRDNKSAVEWACELGHLDMVTIFLLNGCSPNLPTSNGRLIHSVLNCLKSKRELVDNGEGVNLISLMISMDCDLNVKDYNHKSPLMVAAELAHAPIMNLILPSCMDWQLYTEDGFTPLHMACMQGNIDCVQQLARRMTPASLDTRDKKYTTPTMCSVSMMTNNFDLHLAGSEADEVKVWIEQHKHMAIIEYLITAGATSIFEDEVANPPPGVECRIPFFDPVRNMMMNLCHYEMMSLLANWIHCFPLTFLENETKLVYDKKFVCIEGLLDIREDDNETDVLEKTKKVFSPYSCLMRMLIHAGLNIFKYETLKEWSAGNPYARTFFIEAKYFMDRSKNTDHTPPVPSLMSLCRSTMRLEAGKNEKLHKLQFLPLPWRLLCYVLFIDF